MIVTTAEEMRRLQQDSARMEAEAYVMYFRAAEMQKINSEQRAFAELLRERLTASRERRLRRASS